MATLFLDSANGSDGARKWTEYSSLSILAGQSDTGRDAYRLPPSAASVLHQAIPDTPSVLAGWKGRLGAVTSGGDGAILSRMFRVLSDSGATIHLTMNVTANGEVRFRRGESGTVLATSAVNVITPGVWQHYEVRATIADAGGRVEVWIDGQQVIDFTGDTKNGGTKTVVDALRWSSYASGVNWDVSDVSISDSTTPLGVTTVWWSLPNGAGSTTDLTPFPAGPNWGNVDEQTPNGDTDYNFSDTEADFDTYEMQDLPAFVTQVLSVQSVLDAKKTDANAKFMRPVVRSGTTNYPGASQPLSEQYNVFLEIWDDDPDTASPWTVADVNAVEVGGEVRDS